jgi:hypothetical protein
MTVHGGQLSVLDVGGYCTSVLVPYSPLCYRGSFSIKKSKHSSEVARILDIIRDFTPAEHQPMQSNISYKYLFIRHPLLTGQLVMCIM